MNPQYDSDKLGWEALEIEYGEPCYSFDTLIFWKTKEGEIYAAHDSGCSCPTPFGIYEGETEAEIKQNLERVGTLSQAEEIFKSHIKFKSDVPSMPWDEVRRKLESWGLK